MTELVDRRRRMVITFSAQQQVLVQIFYQEEKRQLIEFRRRTRREIAGAITLHKLLINNVKGTGGALDKSPSRYARFLVSY